MTSSSGNRVLLVSVLAACIFLACSLSQGGLAEGSASVRDEAGREMGRDSLLAVFPMENLSGAAAPMKEIQGALVDRLKRRGLRILDEEALEEFFVRHRVRYTAGLSRDLGQALRRETGVKGVLIGSLELFMEENPPKMALVLRLVSTGEKPVIRWMDARSMTGNDAPGFLSLGLIRDRRELQGKVMAKIVDSLMAYLFNERAKNSRDESSVFMKGRFRPKKHFRSPVLSSSVGSKTLTISVLPFFNDSTRVHAGEVVRLHLLEGLVGQENLLVLDPGEIRIAFLNSRTILQGGPSLPQGDLLLDMTDADLFFYGSVKDFKDAEWGAGSPEVNFSCQVLDPKKKKVIWSSVSYGKGTDRVFFFNMGRISNAPAMVSEMAGRMIEQVFETPRNKSDIKSSTALGTGYPDNP